MCFSPTLRLSTRRHVVPLLRGDRLPFVHEILFYSIQLNSQSSVASTDNTNVIPPAIIGSIIKNPRKNISIILAPPVSALCLKRLQAQASIDREYFSFGIPLYVSFQPSLFILIIDQLGYREAAFLLGSLVLDQQLAIHQRSRLRLQQHVRTI